MSKECGLLVGGILGRIQTMILWTNNNKDFGDKRRVLLEMENDVIQISKDVSKIAPDSTTIEKLVELDKRASKLMESALM